MIFPMHINLKIEKQALFPKQSMHCTIQFLVVLFGSSISSKYDYCFAVIGIELQEMKVGEIFEIYILLQYG